MLDVKKLIFLVKNWFRKENQPFSISAKVFLSLTSAKILILDVLLNLGWRITLTLYGCYIKVVILVFRGCYIKGVILIF